MSRTRQHDLLPWAIFLGFLSLLLLLGGCGHVRPPSGGTTGNAIGLNDSARGLLVQAKPFCDKTGKELVSAAGRDLDAQKPMLETDAERAGEMERKLIALDDDYLGPALKRLGWWTCGIVAGLLTVLSFIGAWYAPKTWAIRLLRFMPPPWSWIFNSLAYVIGRRK